MDTLSNKKKIYERPKRIFSKHNEYNYIKNNGCVRMKKINM